MTWGQYIDCEPMNTIAPPRSLRGGMAAWQRESVPSRFVSKGALTSAMYYLAKELGPFKIRVNTVVPTWMWGPPVEGYVEMLSSTQGVDREEVIAGITKNMPLGEIPADEDVAEVVAFFASDRARMVTGQSILVNAGEIPH